MYAVSEEYKNKIGEPARTVDVRGNVVLQDNSIIQINVNDILAGSLSYSEQCVSGNTLDIGTVYASEITATLKIPFDNPYKLDMARIVLEFGLEIGPEEFEYVPLGHFYVTDIKRQRVGVEVKALDGMILLDEDITNLPSLGTPYQLVSAICLKCGVSLSTTSTQFQYFANSDVVLKLPGSSNIKTCRDLLMWICQITCTFARFDRLGGLELVPVKGRAPVRSINADSRYNTPKISDYVIKYTKVEMEIEGVIYSVGQDGMTMALDENPLLINMTEEEIGIILASILADVTTCEYTPCEIEYIGDPALQPGDFIIVTDLQEGDIMAYITHSNWVFRGTHKLSSQGQSGLIKGNYSQQNKAITKIQIEAKKAVDEANQARQIADNAMQSADGKNTIFRQPEPPSIVGRKVGDTWFDTDDDNHIYIFDGVKWVSTQLGSGAIEDGAIAKVKLEDELKQELEENKQAIARKNSVYRQPTKPTEGPFNKGDIWLDTSNGNSIHVYDGTEWVSAALGGNAIADRAITGNKIGYGVIDADNIAAGAITADKIMDGIITEAKFNIKTHLLY